MRVAAIIIILVIWGLFSAARAKSHRQAEAEKKAREEAEGKNLSFEELRRRTAEQNGTQAQNRAATPPRPAPVPVRPSPRAHAAVQREAERTVEAKPTLRQDPDAWDLDSAAAYRRPTAYCQECGAKVYGSADCPICGARVRRQKRQYEPFI